MKKPVFAALTTRLPKIRAARAGRLEDGVAAYDQGDHARALVILRPLAARGEAGALAILGAMYAGGEGVAQDQIEAVRCYRLAATKGSAYAQNKLGLMHSSGQGLPQDFVEAVKWYRLAAAQGYAFAQFNLGVMYGQGQGVAQDYVKAHMWLNLAGAGGDAKAVELRNRVATWMTPQQVADAQNLARECRARKFKGFD